MPDRGACPREPVEGELLREARRHAAQPLQVLLVDSGEGVLAQSGESSLVGPTLPAHEPGREERLAGRPDRRRSNERRERMRRRGVMDSALADEKVAPREWQPLEEGKADDRGAAAAAEPNVAPIIDDKGCDVLQTTFDSLRGRCAPIGRMRPEGPANRSFELRDGHVVDARSSPLSAQDALSDMSARQGGCYLRPIRSSRSGRTSSGSG